MRTPPTYAMRKGVLCVLILFVLSFAAAAERHSDVFYNVLLSPFILTGLPGDPSYAVYFGVALIFLLGITFMITAVGHRAFQIAGLVLWVVHFVGVIMVTHHLDWHPFTTRFSVGILLTVLFGGAYLYWTFVVIAPAWRWIRKLQPGGAANPASPGG